MGNGRGSLLMIISMAFFAFEDMCIKHLSQRLPVGEVILIIGAVATLAFGGMAIARGVSISSKAFMQGPVLARSLIEFAGTALFSGAVAFTPLAQASAIQLATPLAVTLGAVLFMGETVGWRRWVAIALGFLGVLIVVRPGQQGLSPYTVMAVLAIGCFAARDLLTRRVPRTMSALAIGTFGYFMVMPSGLALLAIQGAWLIEPTAREWTWLLIAGFFGVAGYHTLIDAMRAGDISVVAPFRYTRLLFAIIIGAVVFQEKIDAWTIGGGTLIVGSGLYSLWRETRRRGR